MRAIQIERFGGPEVLAEADVPEPGPTPGKVVIDVTAAGIPAVTDTASIAGAEHEASWRAAAASQPSKQSASSHH
jgi:NADPH:quinone reductase